VALPDGVTLEYAGELAAIGKTGSQLTLVLAVAIALVFAVMASHSNPSSPPSSSS
jgi:multidrug efflux pump subunit AcrB